MWLRMRPRRPRLMLLYLPQRFRRCRPLKGQLAAPGGEKIGNDWITPGQPGCYPIQLRWLAARVGILRERRADTQKRQ
jgi:hypothetical protein